MKKNLKYYLKSILTPKELDIAPTSFDTVGDILIFSDFPEQLLAKQKHIGQCILDHYRNIAVVARKTGKYAGKYRTPQLRILAGARRKETVHTESGVRIKLHAENVYFSSRTGSERLRVASLVKKKENILVMFSGSGIFPLVLAKNSPATHIIGVEMNPIAHDYAVSNTTLNKLQGRVTFLKGDVRRVIPRLKQKFDRIALPLPKEAELYLDCALTVAKKGTVIHLYQFLSKEEIAQRKKHIISLIERQGRKGIIRDVVLCGQYSPHVYRMCFDIQIK